MSYQDLFAQCEQHCKSSGWQRFTSKDPFVRALTGGSALIYQARLGFRVRYLYDVSIAC